MANRSSFPAETSIAFICWPLRQTATRTPSSRQASHSATLTIQNWGGFIGQWDTRLWKPAPDTMAVGNPPKQVPLRKDWAVSANHATWNDMEYRGSPSWSPRYPDDYLGLKPGYIKRASLAWYASHHHTPDGLNQPYAYSYLFAYAMELPPHATTLKLPKNENVRILAVSVARQDPDVTPAQPLYDTLNSTEDNGKVEAAKAN